VSLGKPEGDSRMLRGKMVSKTNEFESCGIEGEAPGLDDFNDVLKKYKTKMDKLTLLKLKCPRKENLY